MFAHKPKKFSDYLFRLIPLYYFISVHHGQHMDHVENNENMVADFPIRQC